MTDPPPGELGQVHQTVGPTEIHKGAEIAEARDDTPANLALAERIEQAILLLAAPFAHRGALGEDQAVATTIQLDDLEPEVSPHELAQRGFPVGLIAALGVNCRNLSWVSSIAKLVSLITISDLAFKAQQMNATTYRTVEIFSIVLVFYLAIAMVITSAQSMARFMRVGSLSSLTSGQMIGSSPTRVP